jgi:GT2 family glycosyltransferase
MNKKIAIIIITYNIGNAISGCLDSLIQQTHQDFVLFFIDNNSSDSTLKVIKQYLDKHPQLEKKTKIIKNSKNLGFSKAVNIGLRKALQIKNIFATLLLNQDVYFTADLLANAIGIFELHTDAGAVESKILYPNKKIWWVGTRIFSNAELLLAPTYGIVEHIMKGKTFPKRFPQEMQVEAVTGCALFLRTTAIKEVGFLDEKYFMYAEDIDYSLRLKAKGYGLYLFTQSTVFHEVRDQEMNFSVVKKSLKKYKIYLRSIGLFLWEYKPAFFIFIWLLKLPYALAWNYFRKLT